MLGINLSLSQEDFKLINGSIEDYMTSLSPGKKMIFGLVKKRLKQENPIFDGMYMRCMEEALTHKMSQGESNGISRLVQFIQRKRLEFQYSNVPSLSREE
jgi:hypothetical protein